uniref:Protein ALP1-like n=1 Tax=Tanacetum cinerariifolium TaxID=118510 RepID=A0A6L2MLX6_TANCI|nr:hypothetical protein [Tanacetum cinerariifolium]
MDRYTQYYEYFEQYASLEGDEGESSVGNSERLSRRYIPCERELAEEKLRRDYFGDENTPPIYPEEYFRRSPILKYTSVIRQLAYGTSPDAFDEYLQLVERALIVCIENGQSPKALDGQFKRRDKKYLIIMLEAVADQQLWIWRLYFRVPGANNDLKVLYGSPLFDDLLTDKALEAPFVVNEKTYEKCYYLADDIYPQWSTFVKAFTMTRDQKTMKFTRVQESARKDIQRAFGVLQGQWRIIQQPARAYQMNTIKRIRYCCMILHNMILKDQKFDISEYVDMYVSPESNIQRT